MSRAGRLTPFSYVILALVGRDGAGPHDIVRMMREGAMFWTTSESHYHAEPRRLAALGFLQARTEPGRTRPRTHYELTDAGREALTAWLAEPAAMPRVQNEAVVKLLAADFADDATIAASLAGMRDGIERADQELEDMERARARDPAPHAVPAVIETTPGDRSTPSSRADAVQQELARMRLPDTAHTSRPWRIHELTPDFRLEDVWALPTPGGPDDFPRLLEVITGYDPSRGSSAAVRALFAIRWKIGAMLGWDDEPDAGRGSPRPTIRDRLPADLLDGPPPRAPAICPSPRST